LIPHERDSPPHAGDVSGDAFGRHSALKSDVKGCFEIVSVFQRMFLVDCGSIDVLSSSGASPFILIQPG